MDAFKKWMLEFMETEEYKRDSFHWDDMARKAWEEAQRGSRPGERIKELEEKVKELEDLLIKERTNYTGALLRLSIAEQKLEELEDECRVQLERNYI